MKRKSSDSGSQSEKKVKIERKPEDRKTEKKDVKLIKKTTSTKTSTKIDVKRPENKKTEKPKRMFIISFILNIDLYFYTIFLCGVYLDFV